MDNNIKSLIEQEYNLKFALVIPGPRQFVAETFILELENGTKYFVKLIRYTKYAEKTIQSLPVLKQLHDSGLSNLNYPIPTQSGELYILTKNTLIILCNFIDAKQTFDFSQEKFGTLIADIHKKTNSITTNINKEKFTPLYFWEDLLGFIEEILSDKSDAHKQNNLKQPKHDCFEWLWPLMRNLDAGPYQVSSPK